MPPVTSTSSVVGPAGLPEAVTRKLQAAFRTALTSDAALRDSLLAEGGEIILPDSPAAYAASWPEEIRRLQELVRISGARVE